MSDDVIEMKSLYATFMGDEGYITGSWAELANKGNIPAFSSEDQREKPRMNKENVRK